MRRLLIAAVLLAACSDASIDEATLPVESTTTATTAADLAPDGPSPSPAVAPATTTTTPSAPIDPNDDRAVTCATIEGVPLGALASVEPLAAHPDVADGIATWLTGDPSGYWEREWWVVHRTDDEVHLAAVDDQGLHLLRFVPAGDEWAWDDFATADQGGRCVLQFTRPPTDSVVEFRVLESDPTSDTIVVRASERNCASGQAMGDRFNEPVVELTPTEARIRLSATAMTEADCPTNPSTTVEIVLTEPLGDRTIVDGFIVGVDLSNHLTSLFQADPIVDCATVGSFPLSAIDSIEPMDERPEFVAAVADFLGDEEGQFWPQEDWQVLHESDDQAIVVHVDAPYLAGMTIERTDGEWRWNGASSGGDCTLQLTLPDGLGEVEWMLTEDPDPAATSILLTATELTCTGGTAMGDRFNDPQVVETATQIAIVLSAQPLGGFQTCPGNPYLDVTIELDAPVGDREIVDGRSVGVDLVPHLVALLDG